MNFSFAVIETPLASSCSSSSLFKDNVRNKARHQRHETVAVLRDDRSCKQRRKHKTSKASCFSAMILHNPSTTSERVSLFATLKLKALKAGSAEKSLPVLQTVKNITHWRSVIGHTALPFVRQNMTTHCQVTLQSYSRKATCR